MSTIRRCSVSDIFLSASFARLSAAYSDECALDGLASPNPDFAMYLKLEDLCGPAFVILGAFSDGGELVGFIVLMVSVNPHYGQVFCTSESFFVHPDHRRSGAGVKLLREAKRISKESGAIALKVSARVGSKLDEIMQGTDSMHTNNTYTVIL
jgi:GNAT superfamily N-acetyltransferase